MFLTNQKLIFGIAIFFSAIFFNSCKKIEGEGGTSTIIGRVLVREYNNDFTIKFREYYSEGIDVYIIYGNDSIYSDDFETGIDGWYRFNFLNKGKYLIYAFSKDSARVSVSGTVPIKKEVFINENKSTTIVEDIVIFD